MKNTNLQYRKPAIAARVMLIILLLTSALSLGACGNKGLEAGFVWRNHPDSTSDYFCAYKSDKREFDINDVTLTFYYGGHYGIEYPSFELYFENENNDIYLIKKVDDHNPEDYLIDTDYKKLFAKDKRVFNHSEIITIPKELFINDNGYILFVLAYEYEQNMKPDRLATIGILYEKRGDKIFLSEER